MASVEEAQKVLNVHRQELMAVPCVSGVGVSELNEEYVILLFLSRKPEPSEWVPTYIEGVRVVTRVTGNIVAL